MISAGTGASHQLPGVVNSISSLAGIREDLNRHSSALLLGQCDSCDIHQPEGRHCLQSAFQLAITIWNWCIARKIILTAEHLLGHLNTIVDQESCSVQDRCDWILNPSENSENDGAPGGGLVYLSPDQTTSSVLQLESQSISLGDRCIHAGLVTTAGLCQLIHHGV